MLLSVLLNRYLATGNEKALELFRRISPAAWQHLYFLGILRISGQASPDPTWRPFLQELTGSITADFDRLDKFRRFGLYVFD